MLHQEYTRMLQQFTEQNINYLFLRYPHILPRKIPDVDLLFEHDKDYHDAIEMLRYEGCVVLSKEKLRTFLGKKKGNKFIIFDLYKQVSWWGWKVIDKKPLFKKKHSINPLIIVPRDEDELLIYVAQGIFKNFGFDEYKTEVIKKLLKIDLDWDYVDKQLSRNGWVLPFYETIKKISKNEAQLKKSFVIQMYISLILNKRTLSRSLIFLRLIRFLMRECKRKSTTICLIGVDGSGKSTLCRLLSNSYIDFFEKFNVQTKKFYFGWDPFLPTTKLISRLFKKKRYSIVEDMNQKEVSFSILQEAMLVYYYFEYLLKYLFLIFPRRWKKEVIIIDRYFYDMYVHYKYAKMSILFKYLLYLYPKPDYTYLLDASTSTLTERKDEMTSEQLDIHKKRYEELKEIMHLKVVDTKMSKKMCIDIIIDKSWRKIAEKIS